MANFTGPKENIVERIVKELQEHNGFDKDKKALEQMEAVLTKSLNGVSSDFVSDNEVTKIVAELADRVESLPLTEDKGMHKGFAAAVDDLAKNIESTVNGNIKIHESKIKDAAKNVAADIEKGAKGNFEKFALELPKGVEKSGIEHIQFKAKDSIKAGEEAGKKVQFAGKSNVSWDGLLKTVKDWGKDQQKPVLEEGAIKLGEAGRNWLGKGELGLAVAAGIYGASKLGGEENPETGEKEIPTFKVAASTVALLGGLALAAREGHLVVRS